MHHLSGHSVPIFDPRHELNTIPVCNQSFLCSHSSASLLVLLPATWKALSAPVVMCSCLGSHLGVAGDGDCLPCAHPRWRIADWVALGLGSEQEETVSGLGHLVHFLLTFRSPFAQCKFLRLWFCFSFPHLRHLVMVCASTYAQSYQA